MVGRVGACPTKKAAETGGLLHLHFVDHTNSNVILRRRASAVSKDGRTRGPWFETALTRLLTMRLCCIARVSCAERRRTYASS
jgi:hypothetical protein